MKSYTLIEYNTNTNKHTHTHTHKYTYMTHNPQERALLPTYQATHLHSRTHTHTHKHTHNLSRGSENKLFLWGKSWHILLHLKCMEYMFACVRAYVCVCVCVCVHRFAWACLGEKYSMKYTHYHLYVLAGELQKRRWRSRGWYGHTYTHTYRPWACVCMCSDTITH